MPIALKTMLTERRRPSVFDPLDPREYPQALESTQTARRGPSGAVSGPSMPGDPSRTDYWSKFHNHGKPAISWNRPSSSLTFPVRCVQDT